MKALSQLQEARKVLFFIQFLEMAGINKKKDPDEPLVDVFKRKLKEAEKAGEKNAFQKHEKYREFRQKVWVRKQTT